MSCLSHASATFAPVLESKSSTQKGYWALAAISFFWGTTWMATKWGVSHMPPLQLSAIRQTIAGIIMLSFFMIKKKHRLPKLNELGFHALCGFLLFTLSNGLTTWAVAYVPSFLGALISCLSPFLWVLIQFFFYGERVKPIMLIGMFIGFAGMLLFLSGLNAKTPHSANYFLGVLLCLASVFSWTGGTWWALKSRMNTDPFAGAGWQMLFGGLFLFIWSGISHQHVPIQTIPWQSWLSIAYLVIIGSLFCFLCYLYALKTLPMNLVSIYVYINPMVAIAIGVLFFHEPFSNIMMAGALITLAGVYIVKNTTKPDRLTEA